MNDTKTASKKNLVEMLRRFIAQRSGIDRRNYQSNWRFTIPGRKSFSTWKAKRPPISGHKPRPRRYAWETLTGSAAPPQPAPPAGAGDGGAAGALIGQTP